MDRLWKNGVYPADFDRIDKSVIAICARHAEMPEIKGWVMNDDVRPHIERFGKVVGLPNAGIFKAGREFCSPQPIGCPETFGCLEVRRLSCVIGELYDTSLYQSRIRAVSVCRVERSRPRKLVKTKMLFGKHTHSKSERLHLRWFRPLNSNVRR